MAKHDLVHRKIAPRLFTRIQLRLLLCARRVSPPSFSGPRPRQILGIFALHHHLELRVLRLCHLGSLADIHVNDFASISVACMYFIKAEFYFGMLSSF